MAARLSAQSVSLILRRSESTIIGERAGSIIPKEKPTDKLGNFVQVRLRPKLPEHWALPTGAIARSGEQLACYRIVDGKAVYTPVRLGRGDGTSIVVLKKLKPGTADEWEDWTGDEIVAAENAAYLSDGQAVKIK